MVAPVMAVRRRLLFLGLAAVAACGADVSFHPERLEYTSSSSSSSSSSSVPAIESVSLACVGEATGARVLWPCEMDALPGAAPLVAVIFQGGNRQWESDDVIWLNDVEVHPVKITIEGREVPVYSLLDAFPQVRRGNVLPPSRYHVRVQQRSYRGLETMHEHDVVVR
jgi:hypothetical protein